MRHSITAAALLLALGGCGGTSSSPTLTPVQGSDAFDTNTLAEYDHYNPGSLNWSIAGGVLTGTGPADQALLVRKNVRLDDGWVEAVVSTADDAGLVVRVQSPGNYYLLAIRDDQAPSINAHIDNLSIYHCLNALCHELRWANVDWTRGEPHTIRFETRGTNLIASFDGIAKIWLTQDNNGGLDPAPNYAGGGIGVRHNGGDVTKVSKFLSFAWSGFGG